MTGLKFPPLKNTPVKFPQTFTYAPKANKAKTMADSFVAGSNTVTSSKFGEAKLQTLKNFVKGLFK